MTPISGTGDRDFGYTLLEVLAVILMLGVISLLTFPNFATTEEKNRLRYVGRLLGSDFETVRQEAIAAHSEISVKFSVNGYEFHLGEMEIKRDFSKYRINLEIEKWDVGQESGQTGEESGSDLVFTPQGFSRKIIVKWYTGHLRGVLEMNPDGGKVWRYEKR